MATTTARAWFGCPRVGSSCACPTDRPTPTWPPPHPGPPRDVNLYEWNEAQLREAGIAVLPQNLDAALTALQADTVITDALGPVAGEFLQLKRREWVEYMRHVSEWEIKTYLEFF